MDWVDLPTNTEFLRKLFPQAPLLQGVRILEIVLHQDGPRVIIRFNLNEFPKQPPAKWVRSQANKVQIKLMGIGVRELEVRGWTANNIADIDMAEVSPSGLCLVAQGKGFYFKGNFEHMAVSEVSAYCDGV